VNVEGNTANDGADEVTADDDDLFAELEDTVDGGAEHLLIMS
jgi:hypothetical protein